MAENDAEEGGKGGLIKKILIFGGGGILLIAIGLGIGYVVFGSTQPDPSEQIEEIIERKMKEADEAEKAADNATPQKQSKTRPMIQFLLRYIMNSQAPSQPIYKARAKCCKLALAFPLSMMTL